MAVHRNALSFMVSLFTSACCAAYAQQNVELRVPITPAWALECWVWEDDTNTAEYVLELLKGYEEHDIPARTILIDSPWSDRYNDFVVDEQRYPNPEQFFLGLQERGYRVVLWMTPNVNSESKDTRIPQSQDWYDEAVARGFLAGDPPRVTKWWKGAGGFIDYTNPEAMTWWRGMQQRLFDWGIDGWKLDGTDPYFGRRMTKAGQMTMREYADHYYRDEYVWGLTQNPEFITLSRAIDGFVVHRSGFAPLDAAPVTWVGDQDHTWSGEDEGLEEALQYILRSAELGYAVVGSDVGGYGGRDIPAELYIRWAQFSAFSGLFLNGGHGERMLWNRSPEELEIIRKFAWLHNELVPYIYSHVVECHNGGKPLMRPVQGQYQYMFGDDFLVAPIYTPGGSRSVTLPEGKWRYFFDPRELIDGPATIDRTAPLDEALVFVREGTVVPLNVTREYTGLGDKDSAGRTTWLLYPGESGEFTLHNSGAGKVEPVSATTARVEVGNPLRITLSGAAQPHILRVHAATKPSRITRDGQMLTAEGDWSFDADAELLLVQSPSPSIGEYVVKF